MTCVPVADVLITDALTRRAPGAPDYLQEKQAIQDLARRMTDQPTDILPRLVSLAMKICGGQSAGVSVIEPHAKRFRWIGVQGALAAFEGITTPRDDSPCGACLDHGAPMLMEHPERAYGWIADAGITA